MKTIVATLKKRHLSDIRSGRKTWEVRKVTPTGGVPFRVLCCESESGGKIMAEFICDDVKKYISPWQNPELVKAACITMAEAEEYNRGSSNLHFWHITSMIDYDNTAGYRVRNISEYGLNRAPQSWRYVEDPDKPADEMLLIEQAFRLSPKGCAMAALMDANLIKRIDDRKGKSFWRKFCKLMRVYGYISEDVYGR